MFSISVRPYRTDVMGADRAVNEGTPLSLMCRTWGARPAAVITWFNGSRPFSEQPAGQVALQVKKCTFILLFDFLVIWAIFFFIFCVICLTVTFLRSP